MPEIPSKEGSNTAESFADLQRKIVASLHLLTERERRVLSLRFGLIDGYPRTPEEVGRQFNVDGARIRGIEHRALEKIADR